MNNPFMPVRRHCDETPEDDGDGPDRITYRDPTAMRAIRNIDRQQKRAIKYGPAQYQ